MIKRIKTRLRNFIKNIVKEEISIATNQLILETKVNNQNCKEDLLWLLPQFIDYYQSPAEKKQSYISSNINNDDLVKRFKTLGVEVEEKEIDLNDFKKWLTDFPEIDEFYKSWVDVHIEKCLEHYLSYKYLNISKEDTYIDVAASGSIFADVLNRRDIKSYRLDLSYPSGIHGTNIGSDAGNTKLPDNFATALSLQCALECFMGNADINFIREADRILKPEGRYSIIPLYTDSEYNILTSPYCNQKDILIDKGAKRVWREDNYKEPFSRHYSPESFFERIFKKMPSSMKSKIIYFSNTEEIIKAYPTQRIYCYFMFYCEKKP